MTRTSGEPVFTADFFYGKKRTIRNETIYPI